MDWLVVGLGNPGPEYELTRHNLGFWTVDRVARRLKRRFRRGAGNFLVAEKSVGGQKLTLAKPTTFMNLVGHAVTQLIDQYNITPSQLLVVCDDFALEEGRLRIRRRGSDGGHNGLKSIINSLGIEEFARVRLGIGPVPEGTDPADFVLAEIGENAVNSLQNMAERAAQAVFDCVVRGVEFAANAYNIRPSAPAEDEGGADRPKEV